VPVNTPGVTDPNNNGIPAVEPVEDKLVAVVGERLMDRMSVRPGWSKDQVRAPTILSHHGFTRSFRHALG
jgi:hypothetical protein